MANLYEETNRILEAHDFNWGDILWIGTREGLIPEDDWAKLFNVSYDDGYGSTKVAQNLLVVGKDWWLERHEYDGAEWWEFKRYPQMPSNLLSNISTVVDINVTYQLDLIGMNQEEEE